MHYDNVTWVCVHYDNVTCVCVHHVTLRVYMTVCAYTCVTLWCECLCVCVPQRMSGFVHVARSCMNAVLLCKTSRNSHKEYGWLYALLRGSNDYNYIGAQGSVSATPGPTCSESLGATSETSSSASESVHVSQKSQHRF